MAWVYRGLIFTPDDAVGYFGFVYLITQKSTGKAYVGKKFLTKAVTKKPLKGQTRKRRSRVTSDWENYWGSCQELLDEIERIGEGDFEREILHLCKTRAECGYFEAKEQFSRDVLLHPGKYWNRNIMAKLHANHLKHLMQHQHQPS